MEESTSKQESCPFCAEVHTGPCGVATPPEARGRDPRPPAPKEKDRSGYNFLCEICSKMFNTRRKLGAHRYTHSGLKPFVCDNCSKGFTSKFKLVRHLLIHSNAPLYHCNLCTRAFHRKDHLKTHLRTHGPQKTISCETCSKKYSCEASFKRHRAYHAAQEGQLVCQLCRYQAENKEDILHHLKTHSGSRTLKTQEDKKYKCPNCDRKFFTQKDVRRHSVVHTGRRDYLCQYCPQRFGRRDHLVRHIRIRHSGSGEDEGEEAGEAADQPDRGMDAQADSLSPHPRTSDPLPDFSSAFTKLESNFKPEPP
ncbi:hypothetical protein GE061_008551 [Apolygus lucorum]|uniref:C2H2-type domain-containing protein n=1 Tax=Apolygus lucorum TaxID=248454 RepID=A0A6A4IQN1_APOLU|nr:hypothetical protein GE061_008551 [Apolygus lucorum]